MITGRPGSGKTTLIKKVVAELTGISHMGFYTEEIRAGSNRLGFRITTFDGMDQVLAHVNIKSNFRLGRYGIDTIALDAVTDHLTARFDTARLWIIDEIGKMESISGKFRQLINRILSGPVPMIATISMTAGGWIQSIRQGDNCHLLELTEKNRDELADDISATIQSWFSDSF